MTPLRCRHLLRALLPLLLVSCATAGGRGAALPVASGREPLIRLTLAATNDLHGAVLPHRSRLADGAVVEQGGLAVLAGYVRALREDNPGGVLLLDGGDFFQGTLAANLTEGAVVVEAMNALGYAAVALGNHEFDYGPAGPLPVPRGGEDPLGALKARLAEARFPALAANVTEAATRERPTWLGNDGTLLLTVKGVRVGLLGLSTPSTPLATHPLNVAGLRFGALVPAAQEAAARLRARGAEVVVAVAHAGGRSESSHGGAVEVLEGEVVELLETLPAGTLDAVVAGHTHSPLAQVVNGTPVIETSGQGRTLGLVELFVDPVTRRVVPAHTRVAAPIPVCARVDAGRGTCEARALRGAERVRWVPATFRGRPVVPDAQVEALLAPALERVAQVQRRRLGLRTEAPLGRASDAESPLGSVLADSLREVAGTDVALLNSGGLRADLPAGELTYGDVYEVLPFENNVAVVTVTADELWRLLDAAYGARMGVFQVSGIQLEVAACAGQGRLASLSLPGGRPLPEGARLRVAMPDFLALGGDGLGEVLRSLPPGSVNLGEGGGVTLRDALVTHWQAQGHVPQAPSPGRLHLRPDAACAAAASAPQGR